jgi:hypothetical protein
MIPPRTPYPTDVSDEEWAFVAAYLTLLPDDLPPWSIVYQQTQRWLSAACFEAIVDDLRQVVARSQRAQPAALGGHLR